MVVVVGEVNWSGLAVAAVAAAVAEKVECDVGRTAWQEVFAHDH
jgi:hypothetical protein